MIKELITRYPKLEACKVEIEKAVQALIECYTSGNKVLLCGNGGSCADSDHIVGELMKGFLKKRPLPDTQKQKMLRKCPEIDADILNKLQSALPAISLCALTGLNTAFCNDVDPDLMYAQSVLGLGKKGDILLCMSTSGNAQNVYAAACTAKALGLTVIALTGETGGKLKAVANIVIAVPQKETFKVQELHLPVYHALCAATEAYFFKE